ncbi:hypothetical protein AB0N24_05400 [Arthrobacter sp. NPDC093128]|uniref:hypothetical protein n=1 Tax=Arthrobacter sp. NPDC093128 TaxID=3154979 RepID=UPI003437DF4C
MYSHDARVVVDSDALIARGWGQYCGEFGVLFVPKDPASVGSEAIRTSLAVVRIGDHGSQRLTVAPVLKGFAILLNPVPSRKALLTLLSGIRDSLELSGFEGVLRVGEDQLTKWRLTDIVPSFTVVVCVSSAVLPMSEPPEYALRPPESGLWQTESSAFISLADQAAALARNEGDGRCLVASGMLSAACRPDQVAAFLRAACSSIGEALLEIPTSDGRWIRCVFGLDGYFLVHETIDGQPWKTALAVSVGRLHQLAPLVDYGFIRRSDFLAGSLSEAVDYGRSRPQHLVRTYADSHHVLKEAVPDIFGVQIFGPKRPTLLPPGDWDVDDLAEGRKLVSSKRMEDWYGDDLSVESVQQHARNANTAVLYTFERWLERNLRAHAHHKTMM